MWYGGDNEKLSKVFVSVDDNRSLAEIAEEWRTGTMAAKALRQRTRRGSRQDANNVNVPSEARPQKEEKGGDDSKDAEPRQE